MSITIKRRSLKHRNFRCGADYVAKDRIDPDLES